MHISLLYLTKLSSNYSNPSSNSLNSYFTSVGTHSGLQSSPFALNSGVKDKALLLLAELCDSLKSSACLEKILSFVEVARDDDSGDDYDIVGVKDAKMLQCRLHRTRGDFTSAEKLP